MKRCFDARLRQLIPSDASISDISSAVAELCEDEIDTAAEKLVAEVSYAERLRLSGKEIRDGQRLFKAKLIKILKVYTIKYKADGGPTGLQIDD